MIDLARHWGCGAIPLKDVSERQGISRKYLGQIAAPLADAGLVRIARGVAGGFELAKDPADITLADIVGAEEGGFCLLDCTSDEGACGRSGACAARTLWCGLEDAMRSYLEGITLKELAAPGAASGRCPGVVGPEANMDTRSRPCPSTVCRRTV